MQQLALSIIVFLVFFLSALIGNKLGKARRKQIQAELERDQAREEVGLLQKELIEKERELVKQSWLIEDLKTNFDEAKQTIKSLLVARQGDDEQVIRLSIVSVHANCLCATASDEEDDPTDLQEPITDWVSGLKEIDEL